MRPVARGPDIVVRGPEIDKLGIVGEVEVTPSLSHTAWATTPAISCTESSDWLELDPS